MTLSSTLRRLLLCGALCLVIAGAWLNGIEATATRQVDAGLKRAMISLTTARTLNAVISAMQGFEVATEPGGVGVVLTPGQALRPFNELVGEFAHVMLAASIAFGMMKIMVTISSAQIISLALTVMVLAWAGWQWNARAAPILLSKTLLILILIRFAMPLAAIGSESLYLKFMQQDYAASQVAIDGSTSALKTLAGPAAAEPHKTEGLFERFRSKVTTTLDFPAKLEHLRGAATVLVDHFVKLMVLFILQTLVFPLLFIWALSRLCWAILAMPAKPNAPQ